MQFRLLHLEASLDLQPLIIGAFSLLSGAGMLIFPRRKRLAAEAKVAQRKQQLAAGEPEYYFEEGRSLDAYPLPATDMKWRVRGALLTVGGLTLLFFGYFR